MSLSATGTGTQTSSSGEQLELRIYTASQRAAQVPGSTHTYVRLPLLQLYHAADQS